MLLSINSLAQRERIDSLHRVLPSLKDTARIECLIQLFVEARYSGANDSAIYYARLFTDESKKINYIHGIAESYMCNGVLQMAVYGNQPEAEKLLKEGLKWFEKTANKERIEIAYCLLGDALFNQGKYAESLESLKQGYKFAKNAGNQHWTVASLEKMTNVYREWGEYENLLEAQKEIILAERKSGDTASFTIHELWVMGLMYMLLEEYPAALTHWRRLFLVVYRFGDVWNTLEYTQLLTYANLPDSALYYYNQIDSANANPGDRNLFLISKGEFYLFQKDYAKALPYFIKGLSYNRQSSNFLQTKRNLLGIGKAYSGLNRNDSAIRYAKEGLALALRSNSKPHIRDAYQILYSAYNRMQKTDSAFYYYRHYITLKEALMSNQTRGKMSAYKYEQQIGLLNNEKQLSNSN